LFAAFVVESLALSVRIVRPKLGRTSATLCYSNILLCAGSFFRSFECVNRRHFSKVSAASKLAAQIQCVVQITLVFAKVSEKLTGGLSFDSLFVSKPVLAYWHTNN
jgi:hypothetical protein